MRLYKIEITSVPEWYGVGKPDGWEEYVAEMIEEGRNWQPDERFFWPSTDKIYRSRSSAAEKVAIVERWGGVARILEAEVSDFMPIDEANALRKRRRDNARIEKLRAKIRELETAP